MRERDIPDNETLQIIESELTPSIDRLGYELISALPEKDGIIANYCRAVFQTEYPRFHLKVLIRESLKTSLANLHLDRYAHQPFQDLDKLWNEYELGLLKEEIDRMRSELRRTDDNASMFLDRRLYFISRSVDSPYFL